MKKPLSEMSLKELWELFPIILKPYNLAYPCWYDEEARQIQGVIGDAFIKRISHIGSTAVKSLISKPTVDILLELTPCSKMDVVIERLNEAGWILMSKQLHPLLKLCFNKGYTQSGFAERVYHLHVRRHADWDELYFRDYLIDHPEVAESYGALKIELLRQYEHNRDAYTEKKTDFICHYTALARHCYEGRYLPS